MLNNKGVMRTFEAIIASVIMILGVAFILSGSGTSFSSNPSWEVINAKNSAEDVLIILEKGIINNESELGYYIRNNDITSLENKLNTLIPSVYAFKFNIYELENVVYVPTQGMAINVNNSNILSNGYNVGTSLSNKNKVWHFNQSGNEGNFTIYFPNGGDVTFTLVVVDLIDEYPGYDSVYINLENDLDFSTSSTRLASYTALKTGDTLSFTSVVNQNTYEYQYQISNISRDGNSLSLALVGERLLIDFVGTSTKEVEIFDDTYLFDIKQIGVYYLDIDTKIGEPNVYNDYLKEVKENNWIDLNSYSGKNSYRAKLVALSYNGTDGYAVLDIIPFKNRIIRIEDPGEIETSVSAKRIVSIWDSGQIRDFYVMLTMGRRKL